MCKIFCLSNSSHCVVLMQTSFYTRLSVLHYSFFPQTSEQGVSVCVTVFFEMGVHDIFIMWYKIFIIVFKGWLQKRVCDVTAFSNINQSPFLFSCI